MPVTFQWEMNAHFLQRSLFVKEYFFQNQEVEVARIVSTTHFKSVTKWQTLHVETL